MDPTKLSELRPDPSNPRTISDAALQGLSYSVETFGDLSGVVWNSPPDGSPGYLVCGHQRVKVLAARFGDLAIEGGGIVAGVHRFPIRTVEWDHAKARAANVAANNRAISGTFDDGIDGLLAEIKQSFPEVFSGAKLDDLLLWEPDRQLLEELGVAEQESAKMDLSPDKAKPPVHRPALLTVFLGIDDAERIEAGIQRRMTKGITRSAAIVEIFNGG